MVDRAGYDGDGMTWTSSMEAQVRALWSREISDDDLAGLVHPALTAKAMRRHAAGMGLVPAARGDPGARGVEDHDRHTDAPIVDRAFRALMDREPDRSRRTHEAMLAIFAAIACDRSPREAADLSDLPIPRCLAVLNALDAAGIWRCGDPPPGRWFGRSAQTEIMTDVLAITMDAAAFRERPRRRGWPQATRRS